MLDLKPCPFCGGEPMIYDIEPHKHHLVKLPDYPGSTVIECGCGCGLIDESRETVIERWNTRADSAAVTAEREACAAMVQGWDTAMTDKLAAAIRARGAKGGEARAAVAAEREACADAESDAGRLALELECLLLSTDMPAASRWWDSANEALDLHRSRLDAIRARGAKGV